MYIYMYIHIYIYNGIIAIKKTEIVPFWSNMDEPRDYHTNWIKSDKGKY